MEDFTLLIVAVPLIVLLFVLGGRPRKVSGSNYRRSDGSGAHGPGSYGR
jgi:hypothetical protein